MGYGDDDLPCCSAGASRANRLSWLIDENHTFNLAYMHTSPGSLDLLACNPKQEKRTYHLVLYKYGRFSASAIPIALIPATVSLTLDGKIDFDMVTTTGGGPSLSHRRAQLVGPSGARGLVSNPRVLAIAVFASLGGFVYGCMYHHSEYHPPKVYTLMCQSRRQPGHVWSNPKHVLLFSNRAPGVN